MIRARLGFFFCIAVTAAGCAAADPHALAREDDRRYHTATFTWLVEHEPSAVVVWRGPAEAVRAILPHDRVLDALPRGACAAARQAHALLVLVEAATVRPDRDAAEDCGLALARDGGGIVVAPR